jgi:hypothetical protein
MQMASIKDRTVRQSSPSIGGPSRALSIKPAPDFASSGWIVEANLAEAGKPPDRRFFAVGLAAADEAVEAVLLHPGMTRKDTRVALRQLSPEEIARLKLRARAVRPYGWAVKNESR